ncbi:hypothetical protein ACHHYP_03172 [Achlya hypogyna]|uniref:START domain-containing protein n=1 Tax=Achlya hypogyna TaxID=1202772 RepID=A0A1V9Z4A4_ACHHY|nr:hypothetical protein ACHHYP_03172 [Achlya hypogyna]
MATTRADELLLHDVAAPPPPSSAMTPAIENTDDFLLDLPSINKLLLSETSSSDSDSKPPAGLGDDPYSRQHRYRQRQKDERQFLRDQVKTLSTQLRQLREVKTTELAQSSEWEKVARTQRVHANQSTLENNRLKRALEDQLKLATTLEQLLVKRPRLLKFPTMDVVDWKMRRMPMELTARESTFHAIVDNAQTEVESILLRKGLLDAPDRHHSVNITTDDTSNHLTIDVQSVRYLDADFKETANKCWSLWCEPDTKHLPTTRVKVLERFSKDAAYLEDMGALHDDKPYLHMLAAVKRYVEKDRVFIVMRSVLDDPQHPTPRGLYIGNTTALCVVQHLGEGKCCRRMCMLGQLPIQAPGDGPLSDEPALSSMRTRSSTKPAPMPPAIENTDDFLLDLPSINKLLVSESSESEAKTDAGSGPYSRQHRYRQRQKDERKFLRDQVDALTAQLESLRSAKGVMEDASSEWATIARSQRAYAHQATVENTRLKRALEDQLRLASSLQQILTKRPRLVRFPTMDPEKRKSRTMPMHPVQREASFHTLLDDSYARMESILSQVGLTTAPDGYTAVEVDGDLSNETVGIHCKGVRIMGQNYIESAQKCWEIWCEPEKRGDIPADVKIEIQIIDRYGPDATYFHDIGSSGQNKPFMFMMSGMKRYYEKDRVVIVMKTFLDDDLHPPPPNMFIGDHVAFFVLERLEDGRCRRRSCLLGQLPVQGIHSGPFAEQPPMMVCEYVLNHTRQLLPDGDFGVTPAAVEETRTPPPAMTLLPPIENADDFLSDLPSMQTLLIVDDDSDQQTRQNRYRKRQKDERDYLREQVGTLTSQLQVLKTLNAAQQEQRSEWAKIAQTQRIYVHQATNENKRLKRALEDQLKLATTLEQLLVKRPRLLSFPTMDLVDWKLRKMPLDPAARNFTFHAMMDHAYSEVDSILLRKGVYDAPDGHNSVNLVTNEADDSIVLDVQSVCILQMDYLESAQKYWSLWCESSDRGAIPFVNIQLLDRFGDDAAYVQDMGYLAHDKPYLFMLCGMKRVVEKDRVVIVMRTFLEDALYPPPPGLYIGNHTAIFVVERLSDGKCCRRMCMLGQLPIQAPGDGPLSHQPPLMVCDFILKHTTQTSHLIQDILE